jgi:hypothetical protein
MHIKKDLTISRPTDTGFTGDWDCHVASLPLGGYNGPHNWVKGYYIDTGITTVGAGPVYCEDFAGSATTQPFGLVTVSASATGNETFIPSTAADTSKFDCLDLDDELLGAANNQSPVFMLIGGGFEVHNVTPELSKQGTVVVYSSPNEVQRSSFVCSDGTDAYNLVAARAFTRPPTTVTEAKSYSNSRTWEARDGCYVPFRIDVDDTNPTLARPDPCAMISYDDSGMAFDFGNYCGAVLGSGAGEVDNALGQAYFFPIATSGAYFTGLGAESVLTLTMHAFVEVIPRQSASLRSLATPSCAYDARAMETYASIVRLLPPGTKVGNNASGDWWKTIKKAYQFVKPVLAVSPYTRNAILAGETIAAGVEIGKEVRDKLAKKGGSKEKPQTQRGRMAAS